LPRRHDCDSSDREQERQGDRDSEQEPRTDIAGACQRVGAGTYRFCSQYVVRHFSAERNARSDRATVECRCPGDSGNARRASAVEGDRGDVVAPERRSPNYLQTFLQGEIEKWRTAIKAANIKIE
jgi:hypothetical protein